MADSKITALTALTAADPVNDMFPVVDVSDTTMAASGTTKKISVNNILGASGTATLASATITGALTTQSTPVKLASQTASDCTVFIGPDIPTATRSGRIGFITSSSEKNWFIANNWNVNGGFEITQSTAAGGSTMSTNPTFRISNNSDFLFLDGAGGTRMTLNSTGNLAFPSGKGIDFSAVTGGTGTATANVLNDYEEGTFTATLKGATTDPTTPVTATGRYTKIGRQVTVQVYFSNVVTTGASGRIGVSGLPFANNGSMEAIGAVGFYDIATFTGSPFAQIGFNATQLDIYSSVSNSVYQAVTHNAGTGRYLWLNLTYTV